MNEEVPCYDLKFGPFRELTEAEYEELEPETASSLEQSLPGGSSSAEHPKPSEPSRDPPKESRFKSHSVRRSAVAEPMGDLPEANPSKTKTPNPTYVEDPLREDDLKDTPRQQVSDAEREPSSFNFVPEAEELSEETSLNLYEPPRLKMDSRYGLLGNLAELIFPHTEADFAAVMLHLLLATGNAVGHSPHFRVGATKHFTNLNACLVGKTSKGRKGSGWDCAKWIMNEVEPAWAANSLGTGLSSGEGLIYAVRDPLIKKEQVKIKGKYTDEIQEVTVDFGVEDKRLFVIEEEFVRAFKVMSREGNTLSAQLRLAWDHGNLRILVRNSPYRASNAHISICGHISQSELISSLKECEFFNGFANRFLWACVKRSKLLPRGGSLELPDLAPQIEQLRQVIQWAREVEEMERSEEANIFWDSIYPELSAEIPGAYGAAIGRAEAQVLRISMILALLDRSRIIEIRHLEGALTLWDYSLDSARYLFLRRLEDPHAQKIFLALRKRPNGMTRTEISVELFSRNLSREKIDEALAYLRRLRLAESVVEHTDGRDRERWFFTNPSELF